MSEKPEEFWVNLYKNGQRVMGIAHKSKENALADLSKDNQGTVHVIEAKAVEELVSAVEKVNFEFFHIDGTYSGNETLPICLLELSKALRKFRGET